MKQLAVLSALLLSAIMSFGEKVAEFPGIYVPMQICIHNNKLYICGYDHHYSLYGL